MSDEATNGFSQYCERVGEAFWGEPVNALTNLAFAVAAILAARAVRGPGNAASVWDLWLLVVLIGCIAIGSFLWHTVARPWAAVADVLPILLFISLFLVSYLLRVGRLGILASLAVLALFEIANFGLPALMPGALNGSIGYVPTWLGLGLLATHAGVGGSPAARPLAWALGLFTVSIALRSIDRLVCPALPTGTHFAWHILNAAVLYLAIRALVADRLSGSPAGPGG